MQNWNWENMRTYQIDNAFPCSSRNAWKCFSRESVLNAEEVTNLLLLVSKKSWYSKINSVMSPTTSVEVRPN